MGMSLGAYYATQYNQRIGPSAVGQSPDGIGGCAPCQMQRRGVGEADQGRVAAWFLAVALIGGIAWMVVSAPRGARRA